MTRTIIALCSRKELTRTKQSHALLCCCVTSQSFEQIGNRSRETSAVEDGILHELKCEGAAEPLGR